jgi:hypothetical protein
MLGSDLLGIAVGLILLYLLLSLLASATNELLESLFKNRARYLEEGLRDMLGDPSGTMLVRGFYEHPLINGLFQGKYSPKNRGNLPSYIPADTFALALVDLVRSELVETVRTAVPVQRMDLLEVPVSARMQDTSAPIEPAALAHPQELTPSPNALATLRNLILSSEDLGKQPQQALVALLDSAGGNLDLAMRRIEGWYDATMNRVSGRYKRRTQWMLLAVGLFIAALFNADTLAIFVSLANDPSERAMLLDVAREYAKTPLPGVPPPASMSAPSSTEQTSAPSEDSSAGQRTPTAPAAGPLPVVDSCSHPAGSAECRIAEDIRQVRRLGLPLGWRIDDPRRYPGTSVLDWAWKVIGIAVTAIAITLGAPFWFDMLNKVMVARATLKPPAKGSSRRDDRSSRASTIHLSS